MPNELEIWRDLPYFIAGGLVLLGLFRIISSTILQFVGVWQNVSQKRNEVDTKRNEIEERSLHLLTKLSETLELVAKRQVDADKVAAQQKEELAKQNVRLEKHDAEFATHAEHQKEIRQYIIDVQTSLNKLIEYSKTVPQLNTQIKEGFEEMAQAIKEIRILINGANDGKKEEGSAE